MNISYRVLLIIVSLLVFLFVINKIRKSQFVIEDSLYWLGFCVLLLILSIFPKVSYFFSSLFGFESPSNFIFLVFIFLLLAKIFFMSVKISELQTKLTHLIQKHAIDSHEGNSKSTQTSDDES